MSDIVLQTERLILRKMTQADFPALCKILQEPAVMTPTRARFQTTKRKRGLTKCCTATLMTVTGCTPSC